MPVAASPGHSLCAAPQICLPRAPRAADGSGPTCPSLPPTSSYDSTAAAAADGTEDAEEVSPRGTDDGRDGDGGPLASPLEVALDGAVKDATPSAAPPGSRPRLSWPRHVMLTLLREGGPGAEGGPTSRLAEFPTAAAAAAQGGLLAALRVRSRVPHIICVVGSIYT